MRRCPKCSEYKEYHEFYKQNDKPTGYCKPCGVIDSDNRRATRDPRLTILYRLRTTAKRRGLSCTLTVDDIVIPTHCPVLNIPITVHQIQGGKKGWRNDSVSVDRIDNSKGYEPGNIEVISMRANALKKDATINEIRAILKYMEEGHGRQSN